MLTDDLSGAAGVYRSIAASTIPNDIERLRLNTDGSVANIYYTEIKIQTSATIKRASSFL